VLLFAFILVFGPIVITCYWVQNTDPMWKHVGLLKTWLLFQDNGI